jgi:hypothetical protein
LFFSRASNLVPGSHTGTDDLILVHLVDRATVGTVFALEPTNGLTSVELTQLKGSTGDLPLFVEIVYSDEDGIRESTLSGTALTLTSGATQLQATFDRLSPQTGNGNNDTSERVIYRVNPPAGGWTEQFALIYDVATSGSPLRDVNDQAMPPQTELAFDVHIMAAPSMTLVEPAQDIPFSALTAGSMSQPIFFKVRYADANKVNEAHLLNTELRIFRAFVPPNLAGVGIAVPAPQPRELNQVDDLSETITYRLDPPPVIGWVGFQPGDFFVQTSDDPARTAMDLFDSRVAPDQLIGLFSILDDIAPRLVLASDGTTKVVAPGGFPPVFSGNARVEIQAETSVVDLSTICDGNIDVRKAGSSELLALMVNLSGSQAEATYTYVPTTPFSIANDGRYEFVTSVPAVRDNSGNAVAPGQVLGSFIIDYSAPTGELLPGSPTDGAGAFTFKVKWRDPVSGVNVATVLGPMALRVRTPEGVLLEVQSALPVPVGCVWRCGGDCRAVHAAGLDHRLQRQHQVDHHQPGHGRLRQRGFGGFDHGQARCSRAVPVADQRAEPGQRQGDDAGQAEGDAPFAGFVPALGRAGGGGVGGGGVGGGDGRQHAVRGGQPVQPGPAHLLG